MLRGREFCARVGYMIAATEYVMSIGVSREEILRDPTLAKWANDSYEKQALEDVIVLTHAQAEWSASRNPLLQGCKGKEEMVSTSHKAFKHNLKAALQ